MKKYSKATILISLALTGVLTLFFQKEVCLAKEFNATLNVMAYGRDVTIKINGVHISWIDGGRSQEINLFLANDPSIDNALPEMRQKMKEQFCLKEGENTIEIAFKVKGGSEPGSRIIVNIYSSNYQKPVLEYVKGPSVKEDSTKGTFQIFAVEPAGFKTAVLK